MLVALLSSTLPALVTPPPRIAVYGGSGFIGSRVCQTLVAAGCEVVSLSRTGMPPAWAALQPWIDGVEWRKADALADADVDIGRIDGAVSCVGNVRPSPDWEPGSFFGLHWNTAAMVRENGEVTERIAAAARRAGARRFVYCSVSRCSKWAFGGALEGYIEGKVRPRTHTLAHRGVAAHDAHTAPRAPPPQRLQVQGEAAVRRVFGDGGACVVGPSLVYGGGRFPRLGPLLEANGNSPLSAPHTSPFRPHRPHALARCAQPPRNLVLAPLHHHTTLTPRAQAAPPPHHHRTTTAAPPQPHRSPPSLPPPPQPRRACRSSRG